MNPYIAPPRSFAEFFVKVHFLIELESIEYTYMNEKIKKSTYQEMRVGDNTTVIKISYQNGETEMVLFRTGDKYVISAPEKWHFTPS